MPTPTRVFLILMISQFCYFASADTVVKGWFEENCNDSRIHLHLKKNGTSDGEEIVFIVPTHNMPLAAWEGPLVDVRAERCSNDGNCEPRVSAKIQISKFTARGYKIFGKYSADFPNGEHIEAGFVAKYRKPKYTLICD